MVGSMYGVGAGAHEVSIHMGMYHICIVVMCDVVYSVAYEHSSMYVGSVRITLTNRRSGHYPHTKTTESVPGLTLQSTTVLRTTLRIGAAGLPRRSLIFESGQCLPRKRLVVRSPEERAVGTPTLLRMWAQDE